MAVEQLVVGLGDRGEVHDAGIVDQHIHTAERCIRRIEHPDDRSRVTDIRLRRDGAAAGLLDLAGQRFGLRGAAGMS